MKKKITAQAIVDEAVSWVNTPFAHQQRVKGVGVDCANFIAAVAEATAATSDTDFERNYRRRANGQQMLTELVRYMEPVEHLDERQGVTLERAKPGDVLVLHAADDHWHLAFLSRLSPYPKMVHASGRGVRHHIVNLHFKGQIHSIWRVPNLDYDTQEINKPMSSHNAGTPKTGPTVPASGDTDASEPRGKARRERAKAPARQG